MREFVAHKRGVTLVSINRTKKVLIEKKNIEHWQFGCSQDSYEGIFSLFMLA